MTRTLAAAGVFLCLQQTQSISSTPAPLSTAAAFSEARANSSATHARYDMGIVRDYGLLAVVVAIKSLGLWFIIVLSLVRRRLRAP